MDTENKSEHLVLELLKTDAGYRYLALDMASTLVLSENMPAKDMIQTARIIYDFLDGGEPKVSFEAEFSPVPGIVEFKRKD